MPQQTPQVRRTITLERTFKAAIEDVWELWTTKDGIESWWGPQGYTVSVHTLDLRPGGQLTYAMTATGQDQIEFMRKAGMPIATEATVTYIEVVPLRRLAYLELADFIPGVQPYQVATTVEFEAGPQGVNVLLTFDAMHDEHWTRMAVMGRESELGRLARLLEARSAG